MIQKISGFRMGEAGCIRQHIIHGIPVTGTRTVKHGGIHLMRRCHDRTSFFIEYREETALPSPGR